MLRYLFLYVLIFSTTPIVFSQEFIRSDNIGDCFGAVTIEKQAKFHAEFTGKAGYNNDIKAYRDSLQLVPFNSFWLKTQPKVNGQLSLRFSDLPEQTEVILFQVDKDQGCIDIHNGSAVIAASIILKKNQHEAVLSDRVESKFTYYVYINTKREGTQQFTIESSFVDQRSYLQVQRLQVVKDLRTDRSSSAFSVHVLDSETNLPIEASIVVKNTKSYNALYAANVLRFPDNEYLSMVLEINAPGYFFKDQTIDRRTAKEDSMVIRLRPIKTDDQVELEGLQFVSESDVLIDGAKDKIRRLRDFMALNKNVEIEVIGHVHKEGRNSWKAKRLSKKRARTVKDFLVNSGINADRISTRGMGNAEMKYPDPKNDMQVQANRRVEIKIK